MAVCCCSLAGTYACNHCSQNPFATDVWTNKTITVDHIDATPFGNGLDVCPVCGKPSTIGNPLTNADRIRGMTDEELADFLWHRDIQIVERASKVAGFNYSYDEAECKQNIKGWLKAPVEE